MSIKILSLDKDSSPSEFVKYLLQSSYAIQHMQTEYQLLTHVKVFLGSVSMLRKTENAKWHSLNTIFIYSFQWLHCILLHVIWSHKVLALYAHCMLPCYLSAASTYWHTLQGSADNWSCNILYSTTDPAVEYNIKSLGSNWGIFPVLCFLLPLFNFLQPPRCRRSTCVQCAVTGPGPRLVPPVSTDLTQLRLNCRGGRIAVRRKCDYKTNDFSVMPTFKRI